MKLESLTLKKFVAKGILFAMVFATSAVFTQANTVELDHHNKVGDVVDTAVATGKFKTLAAALEAAGLIDALKGKGPFTVFAPTDEAFAKLPAGTVESLLKPENKEKLKAILLYHVVPGNVTANQVMKLDDRCVETLQGSSLKIRTTEGVRIDDATVTKADVKASNGVIHVIDSVLMPAM